MRRPCSASPICPELVEGGGPCAGHRLEAERRRGSSAARGYDASWHRTRARYLVELRRHDPDGIARCENCATPEEDGRPLHVDHIDGLGPDGPRGHDPANLQALCASCHATKTAYQTGTAGGPHI